MLEILLTFVKVKNYENRSKNGEVTTRNAIAYLFGPPCILETIIAFMLIYTCVYGQNCANCIV